MIEMLLVWFLLGAPSEEPPPPTPEMLLLVEAMGDEDFPVRQAASRKLEAMGYKALAALEGATDHPDAEIRCRAQHSLTRFYDLTLDDPDSMMPTIWFLPHRIRFQDHQDIAAKYYRQAQQQYNTSSETKLTESDWWEMSVAGNATILWSRDQLRRGMPRDQVTRILNASTKNMKDNYLIYTSGCFDIQKNQWLCPPPGGMMPYNAGSRRLLDLLGRPMMVAVQETGEVSARFGLPAFPPIPEPPPE